MPTPIYGIFEGGGAKGLAHVAGVAAAERNELEFIGVAGASAGALIASLVAVGYEAKDLFDPHNPMSNLLTRHNISPLSLIGEREWKKFKKAGGQGKRAAVAAIIGGAGLAKLFAWSAVGVANEIRRSGGYFSTREVRERLNYFLRNKVREHHANAGRAITVPDRVTFKDISPQRVPECCSLKVIVADVTHQKPVIFRSFSSRRRSSPTKGRRTRYTPTEGSFRICRSGFLRKRSSITSGVTIPTARCRS
jgi:NTE family protein